MKPVSCECKVCKDKSKCEECTVCDKCSQVEFCFTESHLE